MNKLEFDESVKVLEVGVIGSSRLFNSNGNDKSYVLGNKIGRASCRERV